MSVYSRALNAFSFRFGRDDPAAAAASRATTRASGSAPKRAPRGDAVERGPGRYRKPTDGPTLRKLQALAATDPRARAALDDVLAGKFSTTQAMMQLGVRKPRSGYRDMVSIWEHSTPDERREFLAYLRRLDERTRQDVA